MTDLLKELEAIAGSWGPFSPEARRIRDLIDEAREEANRCTCEPDTYCPVHGERQIPDSELPTAEDVKGILGPPASAGTEEGLEIWLDDYLHKHAESKSSGQMAYEIAEYVTSIRSSCSPAGAERLGLRSDALHQIEMGMEDWKAHGCRNRAQFAESIRSVLAARPVEAPKQPPAGEGKK